MKTMMKWKNVTPVSQFFNGFDHENLVSSFRDSTYFQKSLLNKIMLCVVLRK